MVHTKSTAVIQEMLPWAGIINDIESKITEILDDSEQLRPIIQHLRSAQGKHLRPLLTFWCAMACAETYGTKADYNTILEIASACELVHMASLVHDDVIDGACQRRGLPTIHLLWGIHTAILTGDYLFTKANKVALKYAHLGFASLLNQAIELMCEGEISQDSRLFDVSVTEQEYLAQIGMKTAALIGVSCQAGAMAAGAPSEAEESLLRFGLEFGCAYQITDDIIDLSSDPKETGKSACNDLHRGVMTLPLILGMKTKVKTFIEEAFRSKSVHGENLSSILAGLKHQGCLKKAEEKAGFIAISAETRLNFLAPSLARFAYA